MLPELRPVHAVLAGVRARLRTRVMIRGAAAVAAGIVVAVLGSFALDWFLDLPYAVRVVHLVVVVALLVGLAIWSFRALRTPLGDSEVAQAVEDALPELQDRLASALDFERRLDDPNEPESREMMRVVVRQAAAFANNVKPGALVDMRTARNATLGALLAVGALASVAVAAPDAFGLWLRRGVFLEDAEWPRRTHIRVLELDPLKPYEMTRGDDLRVIAEVDGERPRELELHYEALSVDAETGERTVTVTDVRRMFPVQDEDGPTGRYAFDFRAVSASFRFWVTGGDDQDERPQYEVNALIPPRVASIEARVTYPSHSGLPDAVVREASFEVLEGSQVAFVLRANMPLASATLLPDDGPDRPLDITGDRDTVAFELTVDDDVQFDLDLVAEAGHGGRPQDDRFSIRAVEDRPPDPRVLFPLGRLYRTPSGLVPVKALVRDDFGIASVALEAIREGADGATTRLWPRDDTSSTFEKRVDVYAPIEISSVPTGESGPIRPGEVITLRLHATDNRGVGTTTPDVTIEILSNEELERKLMERQLALREMLMQLRAHQRRTLGNISELRQTVGDGPVERASADRGRDLQVDQSRVTNELDQFLRGVHRVFDATVMNRLGGIPTIDRLLPIYHDALAQPSADPEDVFPRSLYKTVLEQKRAKRFYDPDVLGSLLEIMDLGDRAETDVSPAVHDALRAWSGASDADRDVALLEEAERRAVELEELLDELDRAMRSWEAITELIDLARQIRKIQDGIAQPFETGTDTRER